MPSFRKVYYSDDISDQQLRELDKEYYAIERREVNGEDREPTDKEKRAISREFAKVIESI